MDIFSEKNYSDNQLTSDKMNRFYRWQTIFYNISRKYYLLGRDSLLNSMNLEKENIC